MMPRKQAPSAREGATPKRRSGPTQPEAARKRRAVRLRLTPWHHESLALLAEQAGVSASALVERWIRTARVDAAIKHTIGDHRSLLAALALTDTCTPAEADSRDQLEQNGFRHLR